MPEDILVKARHEIAKAMEKRTKENGYSPTSYEELAEEAIRVFKSVTGK